jgi:serine/threonine protein kinase
LFRRKLYTMPKRHPLSRDANDAADTASQASSRAPSTGSVIINPTPSPGSTPSPALEANFRSTPIQPMTVTINRKSYELGPYLDCGGTAACWALFNPQGKVRVLKILNNTALAAATASAADASAGQPTSNEHRALRVTYQGYEANALFQGPLTSLIHLHQLMGFNHLFERPDATEFTTRVIKQKYIPEMDYIYFLQSLFDTRKTGEQILGDVLEIGIQLAMQLVINLEGLGFQHGDVKPENVRVQLNREGFVEQAYFIDYGHAAFQQDGNTVRKGGSAFYTCMRDSKDERHVNGKCDVYALAILLKMHLSKTPSGPYMGRRERYFIKKQKRFSSQELEALPDSLYDRLWARFSEPAICKITKLPDDASGDEQTLADFLDMTIGLGETKGQSPREFLINLLDICEDLPNDIPLPSAAAAGHLVLQTGEDMAAAFHAGNVRCEALSRHIKTELLPQRYLLTADKHEIITETLATLSLTPTYHRTLELATELEARCEPIFESVAADNAAMAELLTALPRLPSMPNRRHIEAPLSVNLPRRKPGSPPLDTADIFEAQPTTPPPVAPMRRKNPAPSAAGAIESPISKHHKRNSLSPNKYASGMFSMSRCASERLPRRKLASSMNVPPAHFFGENAPSPLEQRMGTAAASPPAVGTPRRSRR